MKYLLVLAVLAIAYGLWRNKRRPPTDRSSPPRVPAPQDMVACAHCGLHLPRTDALSQGRQHYCSADHRALGPR